MISSIVLLVATGAFIATAYQYDARSAEFPLIVGWTTFVLCVIDLIACMPSLFGERLASILHKPQEAEDDKPRAPGRQLVGMLWIAAMLGLVWLVGFLTATPIYIFAFMTVQGRRPQLQSAIAAGTTTLVIYLVFQWLLRYQLYGGLLFS